MTNVYQAFAEEYFAIYFSGPWNIPEFKKWMTGDLSDKWATAPMPSKNGAYPGTSLAGGNLQTGNCPQKEGAHQPDPAFGAEKYLYPRIDGKFGKH